jgi:transposase
MDRFVLTDAQWAKIEPVCLGKPGDPGRSGKDNRLFVEAVLWIARTGSPWRDLPASFGRWNSVFTRFRDWVKGDVWKRLFDAVSDDPDMEYAMVDATIVKVHRHGQGAKSRRFRAPAGTALRHGRVRPLIDGLAFEALIADKAFDSDAIIAELEVRGAKVVISQHPRRAKPLAIDDEMYKWRHLIENFFGKLKQFKRIAMRADKTDQSFAAMINIAAAVINSR